MDGAHLWLPPCGADVVYDPSIVSTLVRLLSNILRCSSPDVIICSTIRNQETYGGFKQQLGNQRFCLVVSLVLVHSHLF